MDNDQSVRLNHPDGYLQIAARGNKHLISVVSQSAARSRPQQWETAYPLQLIENILRVKGPADTYDEIKRDEDPGLLGHLRWDLFCYVGEQQFAGSRVLDFGCGAGASTMVLARYLPTDTKIVGLDLNPKLVELARQRAKYYRLDDRVTFVTTPGPLALPGDVGRFDYLVLCGVYEHLLPQERQTLLPLLWSCLRPGGTIFINETPHRWFPVETHTTGWPLINYLPDRLVLACVRRFSRTLSHVGSWSELCRMGIRGGSAGEIMQIINRTAMPGTLLRPSRLGIVDDIQLWYRISSEQRYVGLKKFLRLGFRVFKLVTGTTIIPTLSLAIKTR